MTKSTWRFSFEILLLFFAVLSHAAYAFCATPVFKFAAIADLHCRGDADVEKMRNFFETVSTRDNPDFFVILGDISDDVPTVLPRLANVFNHAPVKVYPVSGNHDDAEGWEPKYFTDAFGPIEYSFDHKGIHFTVLWTQAYPRSMSTVRTKTFLDWMVSDITKLPNTTPIIIFQHFPLSSDQYPAIQNQPNVTAILHGHNHEIQNSVVPQTQVQVHGLPSLYDGYYLCTVLSNGTLTYEIKPFQNDLKPPDQTPVVNLTQEPTSPLSNLVSVSGTASDDGKVVRVEYCVEARFKLVWLPVNGTDNWSASIDTRLVGNGTRKFLFRAIDNIGQETIYYANFTGLVMNTGSKP